MKGHHLSFEAEKRGFFVTEITPASTYVIIDTPEHHKHDLNNLSSKQDVKRKEWNKQN